MPKNIRVAAQMYGFRDHLKTPEDALNTLKRVKKIGYDYIQVSGFGAMQAADIKALCDKAGVEPIGAHISLDSFRKDEKQVLADCNTLGISFVAIPVVDPNVERSIADWKKLFREFEGYAKRFAKEGVAVQYHNHDFEFVKCGVKGGKGGQIPLEILYDSTSALEAELDLAWVARAGYDPAKWVQRVAGRMHQVHFKDWGCWKHRQPEFRALGEGALDWPTILKACKKAGVVDYIVEQDDWIATGDPFVEYAISRKYLAGLGL